MSHGAVRPRRDPVVVLALAALILLVGALAGPQAHVAHSLSHTDVHRTAHLDVGTLAVTQSYRGTQPQRSAAQAMGMPPTQHASTHSCTAVPHVSKTTPPVSGACFNAIRGRAPPA
jgi:hypothetical protein